MMQRYWIVLTICLVAVMASPIIETHADQEVVLGVSTSLTLLEGQESLKAVELAVAEINSKGGVRVAGKKVPVRIEALDLRDAIPGVSVSEALSRFETFILEKRLEAIVVGPFRSEVLLPAMDIIARYKVPMLGTIAMTAAAEQKIMKDPKYRYVFRVGLDSKYLVAYLIDTMKFLNKRFGFNRVFIMHQDVAWARATASLMIRLFFKRAGWKVLGLGNYPSGFSDFSKGLVKARDLGAEVILPIFDMPESSNLVRQWKDMRVPTLLCGFISPIIGQNAWNAFKGIVAGSLNVVFELGNVPSVKYGPAADFYRAYISRYGTEIQAGHGPAPAYESVYILRDAIEKSGSVEHEKVVSALEKTDRIGVMGRIRFNQGHQAFFGKDPKEEALACVIQWTGEGRRKIVYPPCIAEGEIKLPTAIF